MNYIVLICGDRNWGGYKIVERELDRLQAKYSHKLFIIEGGADGADAQARHFAVTNGVEHKTYPANWKKHGKAAGPIRNRKMLTKGKPGLVLAFHNNIEKSKGTKDMIFAANKAGVEVRLYSEGK